MTGYRRAMPGEKGWRSPIPEWWVNEANERLRRRKLDRKQFAIRLKVNGYNVSEMKVLRALHPVPEERVATLETIEVISDALGLPRPLVVARSLAQALELQSVIALDAADEDLSRINKDVDRKISLRLDAESVVDVADARKRDAGEVDEGRTRSPGAGSGPVRRAPRSR